MKKVCLTIVVTTALSLSSFAVLPAAAYSYKCGMVETFDSMGTGINAPKLNGQSLWSVEPYAGTDVAQNLVVATASEKGRSPVGFNAGAVGNTDRSLDVGKSSAAAFTTKFVNNTGYNLTEIELYYDMECDWLMLNGRSPSPARLFVTISTNGTTWVSLGGTNSVLNGSVTNMNATMDQTWLTDAQMDAQKLSQRNIGGIIPLPTTLPSIKNGQAFYIRWTTDSDNPNSKMTYGIDNVRTGTDSDGDGLSNAKELILGTNPLKADSDGDGMNDGDEVAYGTNPLDSTSFFVVDMNSVPAPAPSTIENNTLNWPAADGKYYTLLFSETMTGTFTAVPGCVRLTGNKGQRLSCIHSTDKDLGFYKVLIESN